MNPTVRAAIASGEAAAISTAKLPLYERHGFELLATIQFGSSPPQFPMLGKPH